MGETDTNKAGYPYNYKVRMMGAIAAVQLLLLALVHFWPISESEPTYYASEDDEIVRIQAPVRTTQQSKPPPPPAPSVPIPVPNDEPVPEEEIEFPREITADSYDSLSVTAGQGGDGDDAISGNPEVPPQIMRIEEPTFQNNSPEKADIYVSFLVNKKGTVEEATIEKIFLYDDDGRPTIRVDAVDAEVTKRTLSAALNWKFRPAKVNGKPVRAYKTGIFTVDY